MTLSLPPSSPPTKQRPCYKTLSAGEFLWRVYTQVSWSEPFQHTVAADTFRYYGPTERFDHHRPVGKAKGPDTSHGIYYAASERWDCLFETSSWDGTIRIKNRYMADVLVLRDLLLLDLRGNGAMLAGTLAGIAKTDDRSLTQAWARYVHEHDGDFARNGVPVHGLMYSNASNEGVSVALFERADGALQVNNDDPLSLPTLRSAIDLVLENYEKLHVET